ncbi:nucleoside recognition protein [Candidatus Sumerlaeota bacterium]|nr:nucleoside recognition protein [Candidatus Sumerlaeota bacterium]
MKADTLEQRLEILKTRGKNITDSVVNMAQTAVELCLDYIAMMALWLGIMKIADESGLVKSLVALIRPILVRLFPRVPADHPAMGAMLMNIAANMLGLDNAATPMGLKAMKELQTLNAEKETATNDMIMFLAINTSSVTLIPFTVFLWRANTGSVNPFAILVPTLIATSCSTIGGPAMAHFLGKFLGRTRDYYDEFKAGKDLSKLDDDKEEDQPVKL